MVKVAVLAVPRMAGRHGLLRLHSDEGLRRPVLTFPLRVTMQVTQINMEKRQVRTKVLTKLKVTPSQRPRGGGGGRGRGGGRGGGGRGA